MSKRSLTVLLLIAGLGAALVVSGLAVARSVDLEEPTFAVDPGAPRDIPQTVWFQGFLADGVSGDPITATYDIVAKMFDHPTVGGLEWGPESHIGTTITEGWFNIELGSSMSLPDFDDPPYYLQLWVDGEMMEPRLKIASVPTALRSGAADILLPFDGTVSSTVQGFKVLQTGNGAAGWFEGTGAAGSAALAGVQDGPGPGVMARNWGTGPALEVGAEGTGWAAEFDGDVELQGMLEATATDTFAAKFSSATPGAMVIESRYTGPGGGVGPTTGIFSEAFVEDGWGFGGVFMGTMMGVYGHTEAMPAVGGGYGVVGECVGGEGLTNNTGVYGYADGGLDNYGVVGEAVGGGPRQEDWAGYFHGDVYADQYWGPLAGMKIDHPVDPADEYLSHAYVASDDMKTVYDGVATLDGSGSAWVELPDWFEALNGRFRYQLTPIGAAAPNLHIASRIAGNRFAIGGGEPGMEICWQVTGIRHDAVAEMRRASVESAKLDQKRGKYMHPEAFGLPESMATDYSEERELAKEKLREMFPKGR